MLFRYPNERVVNGLMEFVGKGIRTSVALSREESEPFGAALFVWQDDALPLPCRLRL